MSKTTTKTTITRTPLGPLRIPMSQRATCADTGDKIERDLGKRCPGCYLEGQPQPCVKE